MENEERLQAELASFRQEWHQELQRQTDAGNGDGSHQGSPSVETPPPARRGSPSPVNQATGNQVIHGIPTNREERATHFYMQGALAEKHGNMNEAIHYYRQAMLLVPDIEYRVSDLITDSDEDSEEDKGKSESDFQLMANLSNQLQLKLTVTGMCQPHFETKSTHISSIPVELLMVIFKWVVSSDLDIKALDDLARVCKGFYKLARDPELWRSACVRVWGNNCGSPSGWNGCWRLMYIERPHLWFHGVYISKASYIRQGEQSLDAYYRPCHFVSYYRYFRFFPDGAVLVHNTPDEPPTAIPRLKLKKGGGNTAVLGGFYRLSGNKVIIVIHKSQPPDTRNRRRRNCQMSPILKQAYHMELEIRNSGRKRHTKLLWSYYGCSTTYRATGETVESEFDLKHQFPPLLFSIVRSFTQSTIAPLE